MDAIMTFSGALKGRHLRRALKGKRLAVFRIVQQQGNVVAGARLELAIRQVACNSQLVRFAAINEHRCFEGFIDPKTGDGWLQPLDVTPKALEAATVFGAVFDQVAGHDPLLTLAGRV